MVSYACLFPFLADIPDKRKNLSGVFFLRTYFVPEITAAVHKGSQIIIIECGKRHGDEFGGKNHDDNFHLFLLNPPSMRFHIVKYNQIFFRYLIPLTIDKIIAVSFPDIGNFTVAVPVKGIFPVVFFIQLLFHYQKGKFRVQFYGISCDYHIFKHLFLFRASHNLRYLR